MSDRVSFSSGGESPVPADWAIPAALRRRLGSRAGRQRAMVAEGHLLLVLNQLPESGSFRRRSALFWREPNGHWRSTIGEEGGRALHRLVGSYADAAEELEDRMEASSDAAALHQVMSRSVPLARSARNLHLALQEARQAVDDPELINLRDLAGEAERTLELVREDARIGLEFLLARKSEEQAAQGDRIARAGHRLNLLAAVFLPVSALGGMFGMNLAHGLEDSGPVLFWIVAAFTVLCGGWLVGWVRRK